MYHIQRRSATLPHEGPSVPISSIQCQVSAQSRSLWRDPCERSTLAGNYRGASYHVDYSGQESEAEPSHLQSSYGSPSISQHHHQNSHHQQHPPSSHRPGLPAIGTGPHGQHTAIGQHHTHHMMMEQSPLSHHRMDQSPLSHHRMDSAQYGGHGSIMTPMYQHPHAPHNHSPSTRHRPDELDLSVTGMELDHPGLEGMHQASMGAAYGHAAAANVAAGQHRPTHHHHHLPDMGLSSKMVLREEIGEGAPSMVGKEGMPPPAPRPKGPKLKFTPEDDQLLIDLKEQKNLTWKQIADFFPGRSSGTLQVRYCTKLKAKTTQWTEEMVSYKHLTLTPKPPRCA